MHINAAHATVWKVINISCTYLRFMPKPDIINLLILQNRFTYAVHIVQRLINYDVS